MSGRFRTPLTQRRTIYARPTTKERKDTALSNIKDAEKGLDKMTSLLCRRLLIRSVQGEEDLKRS
jgi:hypothetical protein